MASADRRLATNVPGDFFVDSTCIDCDTCRWMAPETFDSGGDHSRVHHQPADAESRRRAELALVACPTGSIGVSAPHDLAAAAHAFPVEVEDEVLHCGFHDEASFGAASYLVLRPGRGNVLVDVPRWNQGLARRIHELGGAATIFLTHRDDVAGHERWARELGAERILHARDARGIEVERRIQGEEPVALDDELLVIPTPGHTAGSACLLHRSRFLFSGDHVAWSRSRGHVYAFRSACWYDWATQIRSMQRLARYEFAWILPGHGTRCHLEGEAMQAEMARCVAWMRS